MTALGAVTRRPAAMTRGATTAHRWVTVLGAIPGRKARVITQVWNIPNWATGGHCVRTTPGGVPMSHDTKYMFDSQKRSLKNVTGAHHLYTLSLKESIFLFTFSKHSSYHSSLFPQASLLS